MIPGIVVERIQAAVVDAFPGAESVRTSVVHLRTTDRHVRETIHVDMILGGVRYGYSYMGSPYDGQRVGGWETQAHYLAHVCCREFKAAVDSGRVPPEPEPSKAARVALQLGKALNNLAAIVYREAVRHIPLRPGGPIGPAERHAAGLVEIDEALDALAALVANVDDFPITASFADEVQRRARELKP